MRAFAPGPIAETRERIQFSSKRLVTGEYHSRLLSMAELLDDTFARARDIAFGYGFLSAIDYDTDAWLSVAESAGGDWRGLWHFPIPDEDPAERIAWAAMRSSWMERAEAENLSQITDPNRILEFIEACPGLAEACARHPEVLADMAPMLTVRGFGGKFEEAIEAVAARKPTDKRWALRMPNFGARGPYDVMHRLSHCGGFDQYFDTKGTTIVVWLLSGESAWMPDDVREFLIEGARQYAGWTRDTSEKIYDVLPEWDDFRENGPSAALQEFIQREFAAACEAVPWDADSSAVYEEFIRRNFIGTWLDPESIISPNRHLRRKGRSNETVIREICARVLENKDPSLYAEALEAIMRVCDEGQSALSDEQRHQFGLESLES